MSKVIVDQVTEFQPCLREFTFEKKNTDLGLTAPEVKSQLLSVNPLYYFIYYIQGQDMWQDSFQEHWCKMEREFCNFSLCLHLSIEKHY